MKLLGCLSYCLHNIDLDLLKNLFVGLGCTCFLFNQSHCVLLSLLLEILDHLNVDLRIDDLVDV